MKFVKFMVLAGAFNWGAIAILKIDLVAWLFGDMTLVTRAVYAIVFISAIILIVKDRKNKIVAPRV